MELPFEQDALDEFEAAAKYSDEEREGHGSLFIDEVEARVARAARFPKSGIAIPGTEDLGWILCSREYALPSQAARSPSRAGAGSESPRGDVDSGL